MAEKTTEASPFNWRLLLFAGLTAFDSEFLYKPNDSYGHQAIRDRYWQHYNPMKHGRRPSNNKKQRDMKHQH